MKNTVITLSLLEELFATHPRVDIFYLTSDGQAFEEREKAEAHAPRLKDVTVYPFERSDVEGDETKVFIEGLEALDAPDEIPGLTNLQAAYLEFLKDHGSVPFEIVPVASREEVLGLISGVIADLENVTKEVIEGAEVVADTETEGVVDEVTGGVVTHETQPEVITKVPVVKTVKPVKAAVAKTAKAAKVTAVTATKGGK